MGKAGGIVKGFGSSFAGIATGIGAALGGFFALKEGVGAVTTAFSDIDRILKSSKEFGVTTEDMVGMEHAAALSGVSVEELSKAMQRATRNGTSLEAIADKIAATDDVAERGKIAFKELGKSGQDLIPLLAGGGAALKEMVDEGGRLAGFSALDATKVEQANDAITRMQAAFTGIARDLAIAVAPAIQGLAEMVQQWGETARPIIQSVIDTFMFGIRNAADLWSLGLTEMAIFVSEWVGAIAAPLAGVWDGSMAAFSGFATNVISGFKEIGNFAAAWGAGLLTEFQSISSGVVSLVTSFLKAEQAGANALLSGENPFDAFAAEMQGVKFDDPFAAFEKGFSETLANQKDEISVNILDAFTGAFTKASSETQGFFDNVQTGLSEDRGRLLESIAANESNRLSQLGPAEIAAPTPGGGTPGALKDLKGPEALQAGSKEAFSAILGAMRNNKDDPQAETAKNTEAQLVEQRKTNTFLRKQQDKPVIELLAGTV